MPSSNTPMKSRAARLLVLAVCLSVTSVTYALELGYLFPAAEFTARQVPESAALVLLGLTLLALAHHARRLPQVVTRPRVVRGSRPSHAIAANLQPSEAGLK